MKKTEKIVGLLLCVVLVAFSFTGCGNSGSESSTTAATASTTEGTSATKAEVTYPVKDIQGYITYGAGGGTDIISRAISPGVQEVLGCSIVMQNKTGAAGGVATQHVLAQPADGYSLLFNSEGVISFQFMDIADISLDDLIPIMVYGQMCGVLLVRADSPYQTFEDVLAAAKESPGKLTMGATNIGALPYTVASMMQQIHGVEFNLIEFEGDGDANTALLGGHIELFICANATSKALVESGELRALVLFNDKSVEGFEDVPLATEEYEEYKQYLPYGPFFGACVSKGTPQEVVDILTDAFIESFNGDAFQSYLQTSGTIPLGLTGDDALKFMKEAQSILAYILYDAGSIQVDPSQYGIERN